MAGVLLNTLVLENVAAPGVGAITVSGANPVGRKSFASVCTSGQLVYYFLTDGVQVEWGIGTYTAGSPGNIARTTVIGNTANTTVALNFSTPGVRVFCDLPAEKAIYLDAAGNSGVAGQFTINGAGLGMPTGAITMTSGPITMGSGAINMASGSLSVGGQTFLTGQLSAHAATFTTAVFSGGVTVSGIFGCQSNVQVNGTMTVSGNTSLAALGVNSTATFVGNVGMQAGLTVLGQSNLGVLSASGQCTFGNVNMSTNSITFGGTTQLNVAGDGGLNVSKSVTAGSTSHTIGSGWLYGSTGSGTSTGATGNFGFITGFNIACAGMYASSDSRLKHDKRVITAVEGRNFIKVVDPMAWMWDASEGGRGGTGYVAQQLLAAGYEDLVISRPDDRPELAETVEETINGVVITSLGGHKLGAQYDATIGYLHAALRDALERIEALEARG